MTPSAAFLACISSTFAWPFLPASFAAAAAADACSLTLSMIPIGHLSLSSPIDEGNRCVWAPHPASRSHSGERSCVGCLAEVVMIHPALAPYVREAQNHPRAHPATVSTGVRRAAYRARADAL